MRRPTFSVITAVRNGLEDLARTYESLEAQSFKDFEWIVIDAASVDGASVWLERLRPRGFSLQWISEPDKGISDGWNKGLTRTRGNQILILNAGDIYDGGMLEQFSRAVGPDYITCCHARLLSEKGDSAGVFEARPALLWRAMHLPHNWASVPRSLYDEFGPYKEQNHAMDFEWFHRYYKARGMQGFKILEECLGGYRVGGHSDRFYLDGFKANAQILLANGLCRPIVTVLLVTYTFKHWLLRRLFARRLEG